MVYRVRPKDTGGPDEPIPIRRNKRIRLQQEKTYQPVQSLDLKLEKILVMITVYSPMKLMEMMSLSILDQI